MQLGDPFKGPYYYTVDGDKIPVGHHINHDGDIVPDEPYTQFHNED